MMLWGINENGDQTKVAELNGHVHTESAESTSLERC